jgi:hypothetical protein
MPLAPNVSNKENIDLKFSFQLRYWKGAGFPCMIVPCLLQVKIGNGFKEEY